MTEQNNPIPVVLVLAGHDPSGGAGIHADIEAIGQRGCHAASVITALTAQNTTRLTHVLPQDAGRFAEQLELIAEDMPLAACKIGVCPSAMVIDVIADFLDRHSDLPVVLDPVTVAGSGGEFLEDEALEHLRQQLLPRATLATPNAREARQISRQLGLPQAAAALLDSGANAVLITGGDEADAEVINTLYTATNEPQAFHYERLPGRFHGSGCTLAAAISADLARGENLVTAVMNGLDYTWHCLREAHAFGQAQQHPNRLYRQTP
ncbi:hydroxymethylpyrimidine/phosphomethylpyrimidine kinase [Methylohalomonas lacus]|uniref:hydroxymethylpyrimidine kinase n=1 Tax=Methylohalomonas lacus TaxID=398773 RepID=A0AAE3L484_9GAMM|nr:bifunctional hydroxymethylpyrimidine kinase/phosphomethylpyrimidine kinase [Methylohalomonas lacus]MCS3903458.1 hydroxymethylpyrimidine/phosphomethylpyrimidine kinase [Methylohalomonas lacus]